MLRAAVVAAAVLGAGGALAAPGDRWDNRRDDRGGRWSHPTPPHRKSVPEFDPAAAGAVAAVIAGGGLLVARRRRKDR